MHNQNRSGIGRREFLGTAAAALFAGVLFQITGCTTDDKASNTPPPAGSVSGSIAENHADTPHQAFITKAQLDAGGAVTLNIQGAAPHNHQVSLTADQMVSIKAGTMVMVTSSTAESHSHVVMFN